MRIRPKYVAVRQFRCRGSRFFPGDAVTDPLVLAVVLDHGDQFVTSTATRHVPAPPPEPPAPARTPVPGSQFLPPTDQADSGDDEGEQS